MRIPEHDSASPQKEQELFPLLVTIVIPHFGPSSSSGKESRDTRECLEAISRISYPNYRIIVIDAGSEDFFSNSYLGELEKFGLSPSLVTYLKLKENIGCAASYNLGAELAIQNGSDYIFLINNDTILSEDTLTRLVQFAEQHPEIGMIGPKIYDYQKGLKSKLIQTIGGKFISGNYGGWQTDKGQFEKPQEVDFVSGAACLIRANVIREIGLFDPDFFIWFEDVDFGIRAKQAGYKAYYYPAEVWHKGSQSLSDRFNPRYAYYSTRNLIYIINKYKGKWKLLMAARLTTVGGKTFFGSLVLRRGETIASMIKGAKDGLKKSKNK